MRGKKAQIDVAVLVIMAVILSGFTLFTFISNSNNVSGEIKDVRFLDNFYVNQDIGEFYINSVMDKAIKEVCLSGCDKEIKDVVDIKNRFILEFNKRFEKYENEEVVLFFNLNNLANEESVEIKDNKIFLKVSFKGSNKFDERVNANYLFKKVFVRTLE